MTTASSVDDWGREVFRTRLGGEAWWPFLLAAALLLVAESRLASSRRGGARQSERHPARVETQGAVP